MQQCDLHLDFKIGFCRGSSMSMQVYMNDLLIDDVTQFNSETHSITHRVSLPCTIKIVTSNKVPGVDTVVDSSNNIVEDKFIQLSEITLGRIPVNEDLLYRIVKTPSGDTVHPYLGTNGTFEITFDSSNIVEWHLKNQYQNQKDTVVDK